MFIPIVPPTSDYHGFAQGLGTEHGDSAKSVAEKVNAGFEHVYGVLRGLGASLADEVETVAKSEFDALVHELDEVKAELANLKMMVQGLGFAGARPEPKFRTIDKGVAVIGLDGKAVQPDTVIPAGTEINVTVSEVTEQ
jgi:hypothetical protein